MTFVERDALSSFRGSPEFDDVPAKEAPTSEAVIGTVLPTPADGPKDVPAAPEPVEVGSVARVVPPGPFDWPHNLQPGFAKEGSMPEVLIGTELPNPVDDPEDAPPPIKTGPHGHLVGGDVW